jgi:uncharacterized protein (TIGR02147 family)
MAPSGNQYRQILQDTLETRCQKNPRYSLRSFARDLGISAPRLSRVLNGHHGLSGDAAIGIAQRLGLSSKEQELFVALVEGEHARISSVRDSAQKRAQELSSVFNSLSVDSFRVIADWYHLAILELTLVEGFISETAWIADQLNISEIEIKGAIERLLRLDLLEFRAGRLRATGSNFVNPEGLPSDAVRKFHSQILDRAKQSLDFQSVDEREFSNLTISIEESDLPRVKKMIREFTRKVNGTLSASSRKTQVYNLSIQFFGLQRKPETTSLKSNRRAKK